MKRFLCFACLLSFVSLSSISQERIDTGSITTVTDSAEAKLLESLSVKWMDAMLNHDSAMLVKLMSPSFTLQRWDGASPVPRDLWLNTLFNKLRIIKFEQTNLHVKIFGNLAVVNSVYKWTGTHTGRAFDTAGFLTDVWAKVNNKWQVVTRSSGTFPSAGPAAMK